ncbi:MAG: CHASE domain-containing protein [Steroidobacteraceae bacterium]
METPLASPSGGRVGRGSTAWYRRAQWPSLAIGLVGVALSLIAFQVTRNLDDVRILGVLEARLRADWRARDIEHKLAISTTSVAAVAAFIATQKEADLPQLGRFARLTEGSGEGLDRLSWAPLVIASQRSAMIAAARQAGAPDFDISEMTPDGRLVSAAERDEYLPVLRVASFDGLPGEPGRDILSDPARRRRVEQARDQGQPIATPPGRPFSAFRTALGFSLYWPVYTTGEVPATVDERRKNFRGLVIGRYSFDHLLATIILETPKIIEPIDVFVGSAGDNDAPQHLATYDPLTNRFTIGAGSKAAGATVLTLTHTFKHFGQRWTLISRFDPETAAGLRSNAPIISLVSGLLFTVLFASYVWRERTRRSHIEATAEERAAQMEGRYRGLLEAAPDAMVVVNQDGDIVLLNLQAEKQFGYPRDELLGQPVTNIIPEGFAERLVADDLRSTEEALTQQIGTGIELTGRRKDGSEFPIELMLSPLVSSEGILVTAAIRNVSDRRGMENQLQQAQKMEAIGNLTGGMAHDFNNLLGVVIGNLDLLRELRRDDAEVAELTQDGLDAALKGAELTRGLLAFARQQPLQPRRVDVNELVSRITRLLSRTLGENIEISLSLAANAWPTVADPAQLETGLINLANNSRDAMPDGGRLKIVTANRHLDADYAAQHAEVVVGDYVMIEVSDSGTGMTQEVVARIFEPFYTTKERGRGTGLGLSMIFGFVKQSGGHINVYSERGAGTTFRLYLPRMTEGVATTAEESFVPRLVHGGGETVLVVEDNAPLRRIVVRQLGELGYRVVEAENAAAAIALMEQEKIDLLLTDIIMPGGTDGVALARQARERWPALKVIFTSGFADTQINGASRSLPPDARLLTKPYRREELATIVRAALDM